MTPRLAALVRRELIRPDRPQFARRGRLPLPPPADPRRRLRRAPESHPRGAARAPRILAGAARDELVELDEILGYHLEQACRYRAELGLPADDELAAAARRRLAAGGHRAALRQDYGAAVSLFERAAALVSPAEFDLALESELGEALVWTGRGDDALRRADDLAERASAAGDRVGELCGRIRGGVFASTGTAIPEHLQRSQPPRLSRRARGRSWPRSSSRRCPCSTPPATTWPCTSPIRRSRRRRRGARRWTQRWRHTSGPSPTLGRRATYRLGSWRARAACRFFGTTPVSELLAWLDENEPRAGRDHFLRAYRAGSLAMLGRFDEARAILAEQRAELAERGGGVLLANITAFESVWIELWAGDPAAAAEFGAEGCRLHEELGEQSFLPGAAANLAQALYALDRLDEADAWAGRAAELGASDDVWNELLWRRVLAKVLARRGQHAEAERLAREAVAVCEETDMLDAQGDAYADLAEVLLLGGNADEAAAALEQALERYKRKENRVSAQRAQERLAELQNAAPR